MSKESNMIYPKHRPGDVICTRTIMGTITGAFFDQKTNNWCYILAEKYPDNKNMPHRIYAEQDDIQAFYDGEGWAQKS